MVCTQNFFFLSHGQATVERGFWFSYNKEMVVEYESSVAKKVVLDGVLKIEITKKLLVSDDSAYSSYVQHLSDQKTERENNEQNRKRKAYDDEIRNLKKKTKISESKASDPRRQADDMSETAQEQQSLTLYNESNNLRTYAKGHDKSFFPNQHLLLNL